MENSVPVVSLRRNQLIRLHKQEPQGYVTTTFLLYSFGRKPIERMGVFWGGKLPKICPTVPAR